jgi:hypothetical protein
VERREGRGRRGENNARGREGDVEKLTRGGGTIRGRGLSIFQEQIREEIKRAEQRIEEGGGTQLSWSDKRPE